jgi:hypothetical protein
MTQPMAGPWDSPKLVTENKLPKVLPLIVPHYLRGRALLSLVCHRYLANHECRL